MAIIIDGLEIPKENERLEIVINSNGKVTYSLDLKCKQIATAEPVKHGHWIDTPNYYQRWKCSLCGCHTRDAVPNYCPNCGARMDRKESNNE